jgi:hypothetical protein
MAAGQHEDDFELVLVDECHPAVIETTDPISTVLLMDWEMENDESMVVEEMVESGSGSGYVVTYAAKDVDHGSGDVGIEDLGLTERDVGVEVTGSVFILFCHYV